MLFQDILTAWHLSLQKQPDGSTRNAREPQPFVTVACQLSFKSDDSAKGYTRERLPQTRELKIFVRLPDMPAGALFRRGDEIDVLRIYQNQQVARYRGTIGEPRVYAVGIPHYELSLDAYKQLS